MRLTFAVVAIAALCVSFTIPMQLRAQSTDNTQTTTEIQRQIDEHNAQIAQLDKDIAQYQVQLDAVGSKKKTLQNTLSVLDLTLKKSAASISATKNKISAIQLQIQQLARGIAVKQSSIDTDTAGLAESFRQLHDADIEPLFVQVLAAKDFADIWREVDVHQSLQIAISDQIGRLAAEKQTLTDIKKNTEAKRAELVDQQNTLLELQGSLNAQKKTQNELLAQTKSQESAYQSLLAQKQAAKASFEAALSDLKAQFQQAINPNQITAAGKGILHWPVDKVRITQNFGQTTFAQGGAYNGQGHNGIDLGVPIGTPVKAALMGIVIGTGDTGLVRGCYSFGRWVMIKHANGLNTMYGHLSQINVSQGQSVSTGQVIAYSGETGYATGPHLHFGVYVSAVTKIIPLGQASNKVTSCSRAIMPIPTSLAGYLNPLNYL